MPLYTFVCQDCGYKEEQLEEPDKVKTAEYDCPSCDGKMLWQGFDLPVFKASGNYQMKAITAEGEHVSGHFGKDAKRARK